MSYKRWWWKVARARGQLKTLGALACVLLISTIFLDSVLISRSHGGTTDPGPLRANSISSSSALPSHIPPSSLTHPSPISSSTSSSSSYVVPSSQEPMKEDAAVSKDAPDMGDQNKNTYFEEYKGKVVHKTTSDVSKINTHESSNSNARKNWDNNNRWAEKPETKLNHKNEVPSFGFVNPEFKPPPLVHAVEDSGVLGMIQSLTNGDVGLNPGSVLGAIAALNQIKSSSQSEGNPVKMMMKMAEVVGKVFSPSNKPPEKEKESVSDAKSLPDTQEHLKTKLKFDKLISSESLEKESTNGVKENVADPYPINNIHQLNKPKKPDTRQRPRTNNLGNVMGLVNGLLGQGSKAGQGSLGGALGSFMTQMGPSLLAGALGSSMQQSGSNSEAGNSNPLQAIVRGLGPSLLAGLGNQGANSNAEPYSKRALNSMSLGALVSEVGPSLLAGALQNGFGGKGAQDKNGDATTNLLQSALGGLGSSLVQNMIQRPKGQGHSQSSPVQSLVSGLAPMLMAGVLNQGLNGNAGHSQNAGKQSPLQLIMQNIGPAVLKGALGNGLGGGTNVKRKEKQVTRKATIEGGINIQSALNDRAKLHGSVMEPKIERHVMQKHVEGTDTRKQFQEETKRNMTRGSRMLQGQENYVEVYDGQQVNGIIAVGSQEDLTLHTVFKDNGMAYNGFYEHTNQGGNGEIGEERREENRRKNEQRNGGGGISTEGERPEQDPKLEPTRRGPNPATVRLVTRALLSQLIPEELPVPEVNSTRGLWDMSVNILFGNPREDTGRRSQFWKWLRDFEGEEHKVNEPNNYQEKTNEAVNLADDQETKIAESRININSQPNAITGKIASAIQHTHTVKNKQNNNTRTKTRTQEPPSTKESSFWMSAPGDGFAGLGYKNAARRVYELLEGSREDLCLHTRSMGGVFCWRTGILEGSGMICTDSDLLPQNSECLIYSFGLSPQWSFEEAAEKLGCMVYAFDPGASTGNHNHTAGIHFYNLGVAPSNHTTTVHGQVWNLFTLSAIMEELGHLTSPIHYLRMDVGGREWQVLQEAINHSPQHLSNIYQLGVRVHLHEALQDPSLYLAYLDTLLGLEALGFQLFSSKPTEENERSSLTQELQRRKALIYDLVFLRI